MPTSEKKINVLTLIVRNPEDVQRIMRYAKRNNLIIGKEEPKSLNSQGKTKTGQLINSDTCYPTEVILELSYRDSANEENEPFMGLEELFWKCYGVHSKAK